MQQPMAMRQFDQGGNPGSTQILVNDHHSLEHGERGLLHGLLVPENLDVASA